MVLPKAFHQNRHSPRISPPEIPNNFPTVNQNLPKIASEEVIFYTFWPLFAENWGCATATHVMRSAFYSVLFSVQIMAFSFVALKIVLCFSFGSGEYFHLMLGRFSTCNISAVLLTVSEMSYALEPANQILFSSLGNLSKCSFADFIRYLLFHQREGSKAI